MFCCCAEIAPLFRTDFRDRLSLRTICLSGFQSAAITSSGRCNSTLSIRCLKRNSEIPRFTAPVTLPLRFSEKVTFQSGDPHFKYDTHTCLRVFQDDWTRSATHFQLASVGLRSNMLTATTFPAKCCALPSTPTVLFCRSIRTSLYRGTKRTGSLLTPSRRAWRTYSLTKWSEHSLRGCVFTIRTLFDLTTESVSPRASVLRDPFPTPNGPAKRQINFGPLNT